MTDQLPPPPPKKVPENGVLPPPPPKKSAVPFQAPPAQGAKQIDPAFATWSEELSGGASAPSSTATAPDGLRLDGTPKGSGWLGPIPTKDGQHMTELSFDFDVDGKKVFAPLLVPTLNKEEVDLLASGAKPTNAIYKKAQDFAMERQAKGLSPFKGEGEAAPKQYAMPPDTADTSLAKPIGQPFTKQEVAETLPGRKKEAQERQIFITKFGDMDLPEIQKYRDETIPHGIKTIKGMEQGFLADQQQLEFANTELLGLKQQAEKDPSLIPQYNAEVARYTQMAKNLEQQGKAIQDAATSLQRDEKMLDLQEHSKKAQKGTRTGAIWNNMLNSVGSSVSGFNSHILDVMLAMDPATPKEGESQDAANNRLKERLRGGMRAAPGEIAGAENTTNEYIAEMSKGFIGGAVLGASGSLASLPLGPGGLGLITQVMDNVDKEMEGPQFDGVDPMKKRLVSSTIGAVVGTLERIGFRNVARNSGVVNRLVAQAIDRLPPGATAEEVKAIIDASVKDGATAYITRIASGALAEGETGGLQSIAEPGLKDVFNVMENKKVFETPDGFGEYAHDALKGAAQEALGGVMYSIPYATSEALAKNKKLGKETTAKQFELIEDLTKDPVFNSMFQQMQDKRVENGNISAEEAQSIQEGWKDLQTTLGKIPPDMEVEKKQEAFDLLREKAKLSKFDKSMVGEKIASIDARLGALAGIPPKEEGETTTKKDGATKPKEPADNRSGERGQTPVASKPPADATVVPGLDATAVPVGPEGPGAVDQGGDNGGGETTGGTGVPQAVQEATGVPVLDTPNTGAGADNGSVPGQPGNGQVVSPPTYQGETPVLPTETGQDGIPVLDENDAETGWVMQPAEKGVRIVSADGTQTKDFAGDKRKAMLDASKWASENKYAPAPTEAEAAPVVVETTPAATKAYVKADLSREVPDDPVALAEAYSADHGTWNSDQNEEFAIYTALAKSVNASSYDRFGDRNKRIAAMGKTYFAKKSGKTWGLDQIADNLSEQLGRTVDPGELAAFMESYPNGLPSRSPRMVEISDRYAGITGKGMNALTAKMILGARKGKDGKRLPAKGTEWTPAEQAIVDEAAANNVDLEEITDEDINEANNLEEEDFDDLWGPTPKTLSQQKKERDAKQEQVQRAGEAEDAGEIRGAEGTGTSRQQADPEADRLQAEVDAARTARDAFVNDFNDRGQGLFAPEDIPTSQTTIDDTIDNSKENFDAKVEPLNERVRQAQKALADYVNKEADRAQAAAQQTSIDQAPTFYHETSPTDAIDLIPTGKRIHEQGDIYLATSSDMAIGQGRNKGILLEFDQSGINAKENRSKPGLGIIEGAGREFVARGERQSAFKNALRKITVKADAVADKVSIVVLNRALAELEAQGWTKEKTPEGTTWTRPNQAPKQAAAQQTAIQEEGGTLAEPQVPYNAAQQQTLFPEALQTESFGEVRYAHATPAADRTTTGNVQRKGDTALPGLRDLKPGERAWAERQFQEYKQINLTAGKSRIESAADVAFIFRALESSSTENAFALHARADGTYMVQYIASGHEAGVVIDTKAIIAGSVSFGASKTWFIHNHPSGQLRSSDADQNGLKNLRKGLPDGVQLMDGIIINLDSGHYAIFDENGLIDAPAHEQQEGAKNVKVHVFDRAILREPSSERTKVSTAADVAEFLSAQKRGVGEKGHIIYTDRANKIVGYTFNQNDITTAKGVSKTTDQIKREAPFFGATGVVISSNATSLGVSSEAATIRSSQIVNALNPSAIVVTDILLVQQDPQITAYYSHAEIGTLGSTVAEPLSFEDPKPKKQRLGTIQKSRLRKGNEVPTVERENILANPTEDVGGFGSVIAAVNAQFEGLVQKHSDLDAESIADKAIEASKDIKNQQGKVLMLVNAHQYLTQQVLKMPDGPERFSASEKAAEIVNMASRMALDFGRASALWNYIYNTHGTFGALVRANAVKNKHDNDIRNEEGLTDDIKDFREELKTLLGENEQLGKMLGFIDKVNRALREKLVAAIAAGNKTPLDDPGYLNIIDVLEQNEKYKRVVADLEETLNKEQDRYDRLEAQYQKTKDKKKEYAKRLAQQQAKILRQQNALERLKEMARADKATISSMKGQLQTLRQKVEKLKALKKVAERGAGKTGKTSQRTNAKLYKDVMSLIEQGVVYDDDLVSAFGEAFGIAGFTAKDAAFLTHIAEGLKVFRDSGQKEMARRYVEQANTYLDRVASDKSKAQRIKAFIMDMFHAHVLSGINTLFNAGIGSVMQFAYNVPATLTQNAAHNGLGSLAYGLRRLYQQRGTGTNRALLDNKAFDSAGTFTESKGGIGPYESWINDGFLRAWNKAKNANNPAVAALKGAEAVANLMAQGVRFSRLIRLYDAYLTHNMAAMYDAMQDYGSAMEKFGKMRGAPEGTTEAEWMSKLKRSKFKAIDDIVGYGEESRNAAEKEADDDIQQMVDSGIKVPMGYRKRRIAEIKEQKQDQESRAAGIRMAKDMVLMSDADGLFGVIAQAMDRQSRDKSTDNAITTLGWRLPMGLMFPFMRISATSANAVQNNIPVLGLATSTLGFHKDAKGEWAWGLKHKADPERTEQRIVSNLISTAIASIIFSTMFDIDDDDEEDPKPWFERIKPDPDRLIDITANAYDNYPKNASISEEYQRFSFRMRSSPNHEWSDWYGMRLVPGLAGALAPMGRLMDDAKGYYPDRPGKEPSPVGFSGALVDAPLGAIGEMSFNSIGRYINKFKRSRDMGESNAILIEMGLSPVPSLVQPAMYRDIAHEIQRAKDLPEKENRRVVSADDALINSAASVYGLEQWLQNDMLDDFGIPVQRENTFLRYMHGFTDVEFRSKQHPEVALQYMYPNTVMPDRRHQPGSIEKVKGGEKKVFLTVEQKNAVDVLSRAMFRELLWKEKEGIPKYKRLEQAASKEDEAGEYVSEKLRELRNAANRKAESDMRKVVNDKMTIEEMLSKAATIHQGINAK